MGRRRWFRRAARTGVCIRVVVCAACLFLSLLLAGVRVVVCGVVCVHACAAAAGVPRGICSRTEKRSRTLRTHTHTRRKSATGEAKHNDLDAHTERHRVTNGHTHGGSVGKDDTTGTSPSTPRSSPVLVSAVSLLCVRVCCVSCFAHHVAAERNSGPPPAPSQRQQNGHVVSQRPREQWSATGKHDETNQMHNKHNTTTHTDTAKRGAQRLRNGPPQRISKQCILRSHAHRNRRFVDIQDNRTGSFLLMMLCVRTGSIRIFGRRGQFLVLHVPLVFQCCFAVNSHVRLLILAETQCAWHRACSSCVSSLDPRGRVCAARFVSLAVRPPLATCGVCAVVFSPLSAPRVALCPSLLRCQCLFPFALDT